MSIKFLGRDEAVEVVRAVAPRLAERRKHADVSACTRIQVGLRPPGYC